MTTLGPDPHVVLGVPRDASDEEIARARRRLSREFHPDVNPAPDAAAHFDEVQRAYQLLSAGRRAPDAARFDRGPGKRVRDEQGRTRVMRDPGGAYGFATEASPGIFLQPVAVDFGRLTASRPRAHATVTVAWTGAEPARLENSPGGGWWGCVGAVRPGTSCVVFHLRAQPHAGTPEGRQRAQFTVIVDDTTLTVDLAADVQGEFPPGSVPPMKPLPLLDDGGRQADVATRLFIRLTACLALIIVLILIATYR